MFSALIEMRGDVDRFLAGGGIEHEQNFLRLDQVAQADQFLHERFVDLQTAGGIENQRVAIVRAREIAALRARSSEHPFRLSSRKRECRVACRAFPAGPWPPDDKHPPRRATACGLVSCSSRASLPLEVVLPEPCKPTIMTQLGLPLRFKPGVFGAEQIDQFVVDDFDDLLAGLNALDDFLPERLCL